MGGIENVGPNRKSWEQVFKKNGSYSFQVSKIFHMGIPIDIETGSNGEDDSASWTERYNSQGLEWKVEGETKLAQNNPYGGKPRQGGNVMTIVKAEGADNIQSDGKTAEKASQVIRENRNKPFFLVVGFVRPPRALCSTKKIF